MAEKPKRRSSVQQKEDDAVPRNAKGGVLVTSDELRAAFDFFDVDGAGKITAANLRKRLGVFYKNMPAKEREDRVRGRRDAEARAAAFVVSRRRRGARAPNRTARARAARLRRLVRTLVRSLRSATPAAAPRIVSAD